MGMSTKKNGTDSNQHFRHLSRYRGKLETQRVSVDFVMTDTVKTLVYMSSWTIKLLKRFLLHNALLDRFGIYFCHYANKVHLIIFNLVFIDFIWLAPRTLLHSHGLSYTSIVLARVIAVLIAADLCLILSHLLDDKIWRKALVMKKMLMLDDKKIEEINNMTKQANQEAIK